MKTTIGHLRANAIAYLALFVALGGTSYAALSIPRNSVGTRQLRNGAVTPAKLNRRMIAATVRAWAEITPSGIVTASSEPAHTINWNAPNNPGRGVVSFAHRFPSLRHCFTLANAQGNGIEVALGIAGAAFVAPNALTVHIEDDHGTPTAQLSVEVAVLCSR